MKHVKKVFALGALAATAMITGCSSEADTAARNVSTAADNFEIDRRIVFLNVETGDHEFLVEGKCSINDDGNQLEVTCKTGDDEYKKHYLGKAQDFTYFSVQTEASDVSGFHHRIIVKPEGLVPNFDLNTSSGVGNG